ncbi:MAG: aminotransferase class I/II-fold pyridoxal phosphate-dependent enzyme [Acidobacteria bacterium]|jgi:aspartate/methionine/tyrosine aminotransferase|nr:MAG: aminotransferase class I/II-fold pyridoxal phosphate-dependent enzyme [Acidobacteriota bacterium]
MRRADRISPFIVMDILKEAKSMEDVVHMEIGEPDLDPPPGVIEALYRAIRERKYFYTPSLGLWELRERIAEHYYDYYGVELSPSRVVITTGTSGAFLVAYAILLNAGDRIALPDPSYPCYKNFAYLLDADVSFIKVDSISGYKIRPEHLEELKDIKVIHITSPSNPTGTLYDQQELESLISYCDERGITLISDEIYHGLVYDKRERTALEYSQRAIVINGFSKFFCMPGFRLGWMILPTEDMVREAELIIQNVYISAPAISQYAALEAFDYEYLNHVRETYKRRRDLLYQELGDVLDIDAYPDGAFYLWADVSRYEVDGYTLSSKLLREAKVAVTPGLDFGKNNTEKYIRLSYTRDEGTLKEGAKRIKGYLMR